MSVRLSMPMPRRLTGLRLHAVPDEARAASPSPQEQRSYWLLSLREAAVREAYRHAQLEACIDALVTAIGGIEGQIEGGLQQTAALAVEIGLAVAREVVGDVLDTGAIDPGPIVRRCLEEATVGLTGQAVEIRLHPEDLSQVMAELDRDPAMRERVARSHFIPDPGLSRAAVRIDTDAGRLQYDHREVLARISQELRNALGSGVAGGVAALEPVGGARS